MTRRVLTADVTTTYPTSPGAPCYAVPVTWKKGQVIEVAAGSAHEASIGSGNLRAAVDLDALTPGPRQN